MDESGHLTTDELASALLDLASGDWETVVAAQERIHVEDLDALRNQVRDAMRRPEFTSAYADRLIERMQEVSRTVHARLAEARDRVDSDSGLVDEEYEDIQADDAVYVFAMLGIVTEWIFCDVHPSMDALRRTMDDPKDAWVAYSALKAMGLAGEPLGEVLIEKLLANTSDSSLVGASLAVIRHGPALIEKLLVGFWAMPQPYPYPCQVGEIIRELGHECVNVDPDLPRKLLEGTHSPDEHKVVACIVALGGVTRGTDVAIERLIELTRHPRDIVQGVAISALGDVACRPELVVPYLISLIDTFEEYDCDMRYGGEHARIAYALAQFGPAAAAAMPWILGRLRSPSAGRGEDGDPESSDLELLMAIGPAASSALPILEEWRREFERQDDEEFVERIGNVIAAIRGESGQSRSSLP